MCLLNLFIFFFIQLEVVNNILSSISSRTLDNIVHLTGRSHIWALTFNELQNYRLGSGFGTDLFILKDQYMLGVISTIASAHSIYIESYIAAKWLGLSFLFYAYYLWFTKSVILFNLNQAYLIQALILFAILAGFTTSGFGGSVVSHPYTYFWIIFAGSSKAIDQKNG